VGKIFFVIIIIAYGTVSGVLKVGHMFTILLQIRIIRIFGFIVNS